MTLEQAQSVQNKKGFVPKSVHLIQSHSVLRDNAFIFSFSISRPINKIEISMKISM